MDFREQLRIIISRFTSFTTRNLFKKKKRERETLYKDSLDILRLDVYSTHTLGSIQLGWKGSEKSIWRRRKRFRNGAEVFIGYRFCRGFATSTPRLACVAFWNTRLDKTASARSRQKASKGSWSTVNRCQRDKLAEKTSEKAPETQPDDPVCETRIRYSTPPLSPSLLLSFLSSPSFSSSSPGINNRAAFFFARRRQGAPATDSITYVHVAHVPRVFYDHHRLCFRSLTKRDETWYVVAKVWGEKRDNNFWTDLRIGCLCFWGWEILAFSKRFYSETKCLRDVKIIVA